MDWNSVINRTHGTTIYAGDLDSLLNTGTGAEGFQLCADKTFPQGTSLELFYGSKKDISGRNVCDIIDILKEDKAYAVIYSGGGKTTVQVYEQKVGRIARAQQTINRQRLEAEKAAQRQKAAEAQRQKAAEAQRQREAEAQRQKVEEAKRQRESEAPKNQQPAAQKQELMAKEQKAAEVTFNAEKQKAINLANSIISDFEKRNANPILFKDKKTKKQENMKKVTELLNKSTDSKNLVDAIEQFKKAASENVGLFNISTPTSAKKAEKLGAKPSSLARQ